MSPVRVARRSILRALSVLPGLVLLLALVAGSAHHHAHEGTSHACAICSLSHAPATTTVAVAVKAPTVSAERVFAFTLGTPRPARVAASPSRAPPPA
jgi:hypothetical protein